MNAPAPLVDSRQVRRNFARAASVYDAASFFQREIDRRMLERLDYVKIEPSRVIDLGCGTGRTLTALCERYPKAQIVGVDASEPMLRAGQSEGTRLRWLLPFLKRKRAALAAGDLAALPLNDACAGLAWSNLALHWLEEPLTALREIHRVLEVGGLFMFSTLGPDTLKELRACFADGYAHTQAFVDMHDWGDMLIECGYADPVMDVETVQLTYPSFAALVDELRRNGAACALPARRRGLTGRAAWREAERRYTALAEQGRLPATFEVIYGHAWKTAPATDREGRTIIRFDPKQRGR